MLRIPALHRAAELYGTDADTIDFEILHYPQSQKAQVVRWIERALEAEHKVEVLRADRDNWKQNFLTCEQIREAKEKENEDERSKQHTS